MGYDPKDWRLSKPLLVEAAPDVSEDAPDLYVSTSATESNGTTASHSRRHVLFTSKLAACPAGGYCAGTQLSNRPEDIQVDGRTMRFLMNKPNVFNVSNHCEYLRNYS